MHDKHHITEEPDEVKVSRPVLKTNGVDDNLVEFNATASNGASWSGSHLQATRDRYARTRSSLQSKRTFFGSRRVLKRLSGKEQRFQKNINHTISRRLVDAARETGSALAFEDLTGIKDRAKVKGKKQKKAHHNWAFYQLRIFTTYKAAIAGVPVVLVSPRYTSQTCHACLQIGDRQAKSFKCVNHRCGWIGDADHNAANIISLLGVSITNPERPGLSCRLDIQV